MGASFNRPLPANPGVGNARSPVGSKEWAQFVRLTKKTREQMTESDLIRALSHDAPRARTNLLARFGTVGGERG